jgi:hypothetical protein
MKELIHRHMVQDISLIDNSLTQITPTLLLTILFIHIFTPNVNNTKNEFLNVQKCICMKFIVSC